MAGSCSVVIRMARDFGEDALPMEGRAYFPSAGSVPVQTDTWSALLRSLGVLYNACLLNGESAGWHVLDNDIIVAFWSRRSVMNQRYGIRGRTVLEPLNLSAAASNSDSVA